MDLRVTLENWIDAERNMKQSGIQDAIYDDKGFLQTVITRNGVTYEFSPDVLTKLVDSGLVEVKIGRRVRRP
jgi:hypothetical protein